MNIITQHEEEDIQAWDQSNQDEMDPKHRATTLKVKSNISSSEVIVRSYTRKKPKVHNKKPKPHMEPSMPSTDPSTVSLISSLVRESFNEHKACSPDPGISQASAAWEKLWSSGKRRRKKPQFRADARAKKRKKEIQKKKERARKAMDNFREPMVHLLDDPDVYLGGGLWVDVI